MAAIVEILTGSSAVVGDQQLQLGGQFWARKMVIGANWTSVRVLVRGSFMFNLNNTITSSPFNPKLMIGLTSNLKHYTDPAADCVGVWWNQAFGSTNNQSSYVWGNTAPYNFHKVGSTFTSSAGGNSGARAHPLWPNVKCFGCDIVRTATSFTITQITNKASSQVSATKAQFLAGLETPAGLAGVVDLETGITPAAYTGTGPLNSVMVWGYSCLPCFVISDIGVCRFA